MSTRSDLKAVDVGSGGGEYVYQTYILKQPSPVLEATVVVLQQAIPLPDHVIRKTNIRDNTRLLVRVIDENTLQFSLVLSPS